MRLRGAVREIPHGQARHTDLTHQVTSRVKPLTTDQSFMTVRNVSLLMPVHQILGLELRITSIRIQCASLESLLVSAVPLRLPPH